MAVKKNIGRKDFIKNKRSLSYFLIFLYLFLVVTLTVSAYMIYLNVPGEVQEFNAIVKTPPKFEIGNLSGEVVQFYPNMKFNHNLITYKINANCDLEKQNRVKEAFKELEENVIVLKFIENVNLNIESDINIICSREEKNAIDEDFYIMGEGGAKHIIQTSRYNVISSGKILLYDDPTRFTKCEWPNIELHEILHVFGFDHSTNEDSLMYPYLSSCDQKLDVSIIEELNSLYSKENLADLYFENVTGSKKGRYLDFNISIKNSGVINAENVELTVIDNGNIIKEFDLNDTAYGAGINFFVTNLKLKSRSSKNISLVIDYNNLIKEIDEENNEAVLDFS